MKKTDKHEEINLQRRKALAKLGMVATAVYAAPTLMTLSQSAHASPDDDKPSTPSVASAPSEPSVPSIPSAPSAPSAPSVVSAPSSPSIISAPSSPSIISAPSAPTT